MKDQQALESLPPDLQPYFLKETPGQKFGAAKFWELIKPKMDNLKKHVEVLEAECKRLHDKYDFQLLVTSREEMKTLLSECLKNWPPQGGSNEYKDWTERVKKVMK